MTSISAWFDLQIFNHSLTLVDLQCLSNLYWLGRPPVIGRYKPSLVRLCVLRHEAGSFVCRTFVDRPSFCRALVDLRQLFVVCYSCTLITALPIFGQEMGECTDRVSA